MHVININKNSTSRFGCSVCAELKPTLCVCLCVKAVVKYVINTRNTQIQFVACPFETVMCTIFSHSFIKSISLRFYLSSSLVLHLFTHLLLWLLFGSSNIQMVPSTKCKIFKWILVSLCYCSTIFNSNLFRQTKHRKNGAANDWKMELHWTLFFSICQNMFWVKKKQRINWNVYHANAANSKRFRRRLNNKGTKSSLICKFEFLLHIFSVQNENSFVGSIESTGATYNNIFGLSNRNIRKWTQFLFLTRCSKKMIFWLL